MAITSAHSDCNGRVPKGYIPCEGIDLALRFDACPSVPAALNFDRNVPLRDGDQVLSFGFHSGNAVLRGPRSWSGHISSSLNSLAENQTCSKHWCCWYCVVATVFPKSDLTTLLVCPNALPVIQR
jgi:hypothetical protein